VDLQQISRLFSSCWWWWRWYYYGGGGGAGGFRESQNCSFRLLYSKSLIASGSTAITVTVQGYPITVGGGGSTRANLSPVEVTPGSNSVFSTITSTGGGGVVMEIHATAPVTGGSGGGGGASGGLPI
jgi:hypothetical protein